MKVPRYGNAYSIIPSPFEAVHRLRQRRLHVSYKGLLSERPRAFHGALVSSFYISFERLHVLEGLAIQTFSSKLCFFSHFRILLIVQTNLYFSNDILSLVSSHRGSNSGVPVEFPNFHFVFAKVE